jgi:hypothetical protein
MSQDIIIDTKAYHFVNGYCWICDSFYYRCTLCEVALYLPQDHVCLNNVITDFNDSGFIDSFDMYAKFHDCVVYEE